MEILRLDNQTSLELHKILQKLINNPEARDSDWVEQKWIYDPELGEDALKSFTTYWSNERWADELTISDARFRQLISYIDRRGFLDPIMEPDGQKKAVRLSLHGELFFKLGGFTQEWKDQRLERRDKRLRRAVWISSLVGSGAGGFVLGLLVNWFAT